MDAEEKSVATRSRGLARTGARASAAPVEIDADTLFQGRSEVALRFGDAVYHLKITRFGKLILNK